MQRLANLVDLVSMRTDRRVDNVEMMAYGCQNVYLARIRLAKWKVLCGLRQNADHVDTAPEIANYMRCGNHYAQTEKIEHQIVPANLDVRRGL